MNMRLIGCCACVAAAGITASAQGQCSMDVVQEITGPHFGPIATDSVTAAFGYTMQDCAYVCDRRAGPWLYAQQFAGTDTEAGDWFGSSITVAGDLVIVGAPMDDDRGQDSGSAYVFRHDGAQWGQEQKLLASDGRSGKNFGSAVAIFGDMILVGAMFGDSQSWEGVVYVFEQVGGLWQETQRFADPDLRSGDKFGADLFVDGDRVAVGGERGRPVWIYRYDGGWSQEQKIEPVPGSTDRWWCFGLSGDRLVVGTELNNTDMWALVYEFDGTQWALTETIPRNGWGAIRLSGDSILTTWWDPGGSPTDLLLYRFDGSAWPLVATLNLGGNNSAIALRDDLIIAGTPDGNYACEIPRFITIDCSCPADFNGDGAVNSQDFILFLNLFVAGDPSADFNGDGVVNSQDFIAFLNAFVAGC